MGGDDGNVIVKPGQPYIDPAHATMPGKTLLIQYDLVLRSQRSSEQSDLLMSSPNTPQSDLKLTELVAVAPCG